MEELVLQTGKSCEDCVFFEDSEKCRKHKIKKCGIKLFFAYKDIATKDKQSDDYLEKCKFCDYLSHRQGYTPHCHYKGTKKSPVIDDKFKCPKE